MYGRQRKTPLHHYLAPYIFKPANLLHIHAVDSTDLAHQPYDQLVKRIHSICLDMMTSRHRFLLTPPRRGKSLPKNFI